MRGDSQLIGSPRLTACLPRPVIAASAQTVIATTFRLIAPLGQHWHDWVRICHHYSIAAHSLPWFGTAMSPISPPCDSSMPICPRARVQRACTRCSFLLVLLADRPALGVRRLLQSITAASAYPASVQCSIAADTARVCACECPRAQANHQPPTSKAGLGWSGPLCAYAYA